MDIVIRTIAGRGIDTPKGTGERINSKGQRTKSTQGEKTNKRNKN